MKHWFLSCPERVPIVVSSESFDNLLRSKVNCQVALIYFSLMIGEDKLGIIVYKFNFFAHLPWSWWWIFKP